MKKPLLRFFKNEVDPNIVWEDFIARFSDDEDDEFFFLKIFLLLLYLTGDFPLDNSHSWENRVQK